MVIQAVFPILISRKERGGKQMQELIIQTKDLTKIYGEDVYKRQVLLTLAYSLAV